MPNVIVWIYRYLIGLNDFPNHPYYSVIASVIRLCRLVNEEQSKGTYQLTSVTSFLYMFLHFFLNPPPLPPSPPPLHPTLSPAPAKCSFVRILENNTKHLKINPRLFGFRGEGKRGKGKKGCDNVSERK